MDSFSFWLEEVVTLRLRFQTNGEKQKFLTFIFLEFLLSHFTTT